LDNRPLKDTGNCCVIRSGTVVKGTVEYRSGASRKGMPRKFLDIRFSNYPLIKGKGQLRLSLPPARTGLGGVQS
jgi:hypothetical protein